MSFVGEKGGATPDYYDAHAGTIRRVFTVLDPVFDTDVSLQELVCSSQPWVKGDHGFNSYKFSFNKAQEDKLTALYHELDMVAQRDLPPGNYNHLLVFGAVHLGNDKRMAYLADMLDPARGITTEHITLLGGQRAMFPEREPEDLLRSVGRIFARRLQSAAGQTAEDTWLAKLLERSPNIDESDMLRIAALDRLGAMSVSQMVLHIGEELSNDTSTPVTRYDFHAEPGNVAESIPITMLHSRARPRKDGERRHTTESCTLDWAKEFQPAEGSRVAMVGSQPHLDRMAMTVQRALRSIGRDDIVLTTGGPGTTEATGHTIYLGEVARNLYETQQLREG